MKYLILFIFWIMLYLGFPIKRFVIYIFAINLK